MEKLFALAAVGQKIYGRWLFLRLLSGIAIVAGLTIVVSILMGALLVGGFFAAYQLLLHYGLDPLTSCLIVGASVVIVIFIFVLLAIQSVRNLEELPRKLLKKKSPLAARADEMIDAFLAGLFGSPADPR